MEDNSITTKTWIGLSFLALFGDILTLIPIVGDVVGPVFWIGIGVFGWSIISAIFISAITHMHAAPSPAIQFLGQMGRM